MEVEEFDLDRSVNRAWSSFRRRLADVLDALGDDDVLLIEAASSIDDDDEGSAPYVQVVANGEVLNAEVSSNAFLTEGSRLSEPMTAELVRVGWTSPAPGAGSPNFSTTVDPTQTDRLAAMTVSAFRDVWGVPHPTFLDAGDTNDALGISRDTPRPVTVPTRTGNRDHVQRLVDDTLTGYLGQEPHKDGDGDIPVRSGSALVFIRVLDDQPLVELKSPLVVDISGRTRAAEVIADLNANWRMAKFVLIRDVVVVLVEVLTQPFVPEHLVEMLQYISRLADDLDDELAERLGGRLPFVDQPAAPPTRSAGQALIGSRAGHDGLPPELVNLLHLSSGDPLPAQDTARICGDSRERILEFLQTASSQEISWRRCADEARLAGDDTEAARCDREADTWQRTVDHLRAALRDVVTRRPDPGRPDAA